MDAFEVDLDLDAVVDLDFFAESSVPAAALAAVPADLVDLVDADPAVDFPEDLVDDFVVVVFFPEVSDDDFAEAFVAFALVVVDFLGAFVVDFDDFVPAVVPAALLLVVVRPVDPPDFVDALRGVLFVFFSAVFLASSSAAVFVVLDVVVDTSFLSKDGRVLRRCPLQ